ncbi:MAG: hypothetical protein U9R60_12905 [Bacteroidota bacterium]|nr:hypothetical protein [Bacteroidota bacterium]
MRKNQIIIDQISDLNPLVGEIKTIEGDVVKKASVRIEEDQPYETTVWTSGSEKFTGDRVIASVDNNHEYRCSTGEEGGTTSGTEPVWPTDGGSIEDGEDIVWQDMGIYDPSTLLEYVRFYYHCSPGNTDDGFQAFNVSDKVLVIEEGAVHFIIGFEDLKPRACEKVILAGTYNNCKFLRSIDEGQTWTDIGAQYPPSDVLYTGTWTNSYVMGETIQGGTSGAMGVVLSGTVDTRLAYTPAGPPEKVFQVGEVVIGLSSGAYSTITGKGSLSECGISEIASMGDTGIAIAGVFSYIEIKGNVLRTTDKGLTWTDLGVLFGAHDIYAVEYLENGICLAGSQPLSHVFKSTDFGLTWYDKGNLETPNSTITGFAYVGNGICLASTYWYNEGTSAHQGSIWRSIDYGNNWTKVLASNPAENWYLETVHYLENGICLAGGGFWGNIWRSINYGQTWEVTRPTAYAHYIVSFAYLGSGICLAGGTYSGGTGHNLWRSTNYGADWVGAGISPHGITEIYAVEYLGNNICLVGGNNGAKIIRSTDKGLNWTDLGGQAGEIGVNAITRLGIK